MSKLSDIYRQAHKEAAMALGLAVLYFVWWYTTAYGLAPALGDTSMPALIWGMPVWFFFSCLIGPILFTVLCYLMVKMFYKDVPLDIAPEEDDHE